MEFSKFFRRSQPEANPIPESAGTDPHFDDFSQETLEILLTETTKKRDGLLSIGKGKNTGEILKQITELNIERTKIIAALKNKKHSHEKEKSTPA